MIFVVQRSLREKRTRPAFHMKIVKADVHFAVMTSENIVAHVFFRDSGFLAWNQAGGPRKIKGLALIEEPVERIKNPVRAAAGIVKTS